MTPTDSELNLAAARICGFNDIGVNGIPLDDNWRWFTPANDITDAMRVVERLRAKGVGFEICCDDKGWAVWVMSTEGAKADDPELPRALTLAAVRAAEKGRE